MKVLLGVAGGISAYKTVEIVRRLRERGDEVQVVFTRTAREFVTETTFAVVSGRPVLTSLFGRPEVARVEHVELAAWADLLAVAPATAEVIAKFAGGFADDALSTLYLSFTGKVLLAPAMETAMWEQPAVRENVARLASRGAEVVGPVAGRLASGKNGMGRMAEPEEIVAHAVRLVEGRNDLARVPVLVTAGPTREPVDTVRFVSNRSSGRMGFALAEAARDRGASVVLLAGPTELAPPAGVTVHRFESAAELAALLAAEFPRCRVLAMAAAVSDFIPERVPRRLHRSEGPRSLALSPGADLVATLAAQKGDRIVVAFAAEEGPGEERARRKMTAKKADWIVFNDVSRPGIGFGSEENEAVLLSSGGERIDVTRRSKRALADKIWDAVCSQLAWRTIPQKI